MLFIIRRLLEGSVCRCLVQVRVYSSRSGSSAFRGRATVVPFSVTEKEARGIFDAWHRSAWLSPSNLLDSENLTLQTAHFPFWCFETELSFSYTATPAFQTDSGEVKRERTCRGILPDELFSFGCPEMQVYASYKHRRDFTEAAKMHVIPETSFQVHAGNPLLKSSPFEEPKLRQGMAWELALRSARKRKHSELEQHLKAASGAVEIEDLHLSMKVLNRKAKLYYFPSYIMDYTFSRSYSVGGELQENKFQTMVGGTTSGRVMGERHYCPRKTRLATSVIGGGLGAGIAALSDTSLSICLAETMFWTFMAATFSGVYAKYSAIIDRWHQIHRLDWEHQQYAKQYFKECRRDQDQSFSDYQDYLRCENEWRQWEEIQKWNWKEDERHKWGETLWREQHQRRRDNIRFRLKMEQQRQPIRTIVTRYLDILHVCRMQREQGERREERRRRRFGGSEYFHHHGVEDFAWKLNAGGNRDAFGYYALLCLDPKGSWTEKDIKDAFQKQAMRWHPDLHAKHQATNGEHRNLDQMRERFQSLREAYEVLRDPKKRSLYREGRLQRSQI